MNTLGFDLTSTSVGWSYFVLGILMSAGTWKLNLRPDSTGLRWARLLHHLQNIKRSGLEFGQVVYEDVTFRSSQKGGWRSEHLWGGAKAILELWFESLDLPDSCLVGIHVADVKMVAVGKGGGPGTEKEAMLAAARALWPRVKIPDHHSADACWVVEAASKGMHLKRAAARRLRKTAAPAPRLRQLSLPGSRRS